MHRRFQKFREYPAEIVFGGTKAEFVLDFRRGANDLQLAEGDGDRAARGANGWKNPAENTHHKSEEDSRNKQAKGDFEREGDVREGLKIHRVRCQAV